MGPSRGFSSADADCLSWSFASPQRDTHRLAISQQGGTGTPQRLDACHAAERALSGLPSSPAVAAAILGGVGGLAAPPSCLERRTHRRNRDPGECRAAALAADCENGQAFVPRITNTAMSSAQGTFENGKEALVFRASGGSAGKEPGYLVLTPLRLKVGRHCHRQSRFRASRPQGAKQPARGLDPRRNAGHRADAPARGAQFVHPRRQSGGRSLISPAIRT